MEPAACLCPAPILQKQESLSEQLVRVSPSVCFESEVLLSICSGSPASWCSSKESQLFCLQASPPNSWIIQFSQGRASQHQIRKSLSIVNPLLPPALKHSIPLSTQTVHLFFLKKLNLLSSHAQRLLGKKPKDRNKHTVSPICGITSG